MQDKVSLLMEETGCDRGEAELALELSGFQVEEAIKTIGRLLRNIAVVKAKFACPEQDQFGLFLVVANVKTGGLLRSRAVVSFNPAVYAANLDRHWFEFEKHLYGCRLWDGSLQAESLDIEQRLAAHFRDSAACARLGRDDDDAGLAESLAAVVGGALRSPARKLQLKREILDVRQFQSLKADPDRAGRAKSAGRPQKDELLVLKCALQEDVDGVAAEELRAGDMVSAQIVDGRDIAQYLAKLFGGHSDKGPVPVLAPVEAIESGPNGLLARVRFSVGVCGDAIVPAGTKLRVVRLAKGDEAPSWWRRLFK